MDNFSRTAQVRERIANLRSEADSERMLRVARTTPGVLPAAVSGRSIRVAVGRLLIGAGRAIAGPAQEPRKVDAAAGGPSAGQAGAGHAA